MDTSRNPSGDLESQFEPTIRSLGDCARVARNLLQWLEASGVPNGRDYLGLPSYLKRIKEAVEHASGPADLHDTMNSVMLAIDRGGADPSSPDLPEQWVLQFDELVFWISLFRAGKIREGQALTKEMMSHPAGFAMQRRKRV